jgi:hypothetical protein
MQIEEPSPLRGSGNPLKPMKERYRTKVDHLLLIGALRSASLGGNKIINNGHYPSASDHL